MTYVGVGFELCPLNPIQRDSFSIQRWQFFFFIRCSGLLHTGPDAAHARLRPALPMMVSSKGCRTRGDNRPCNSCGSSESCTPLLSPSAALLCILCCWRRKFKARFGWCVHVCLKHLAMAQHGPVSLISSIPGSIRRSSREKPTRLLHLCSHQENAAKAWKPFGLPRAQSRAQGAQKARTHAVHPPPCRTSIAIDRPQLSRYR